MACGAPQTPAAAAVLMEAVLTDAGLTDAVSAGTAVAAGVTPSRAQHAVPVTVAVAATMASSLLARGLLARGPRIPMTRLLLLLLDYFSIVRFLAADAEPASRALPAYRATRWYVPGPSRLAASAQLAVRVFSVIVQTVAEPARTVTVPAGVPPYLGVTVIVSFSDCSRPSTTRLADSRSTVVVGACTALFTRKPAW
jgi:hypothetical protein